MKKEKIKGHKAKRKWLIQMYHDVQSWQLLRRNRMVVVDIKDIS